MITIRGEEWGTAAELAARLGTTVAAIRNAANRGRLRRVRMADDDGRPAVYYPLIPAARIEAAARRSGRGRPRRLDAPHASGA
jgi:hypothetical protein